MQAIGLNEKRSLEILKSLTKEDKEEIEVFIQTKIEENRKKLSLKDKLFLILGASLGTGLVVICFLACSGVITNMTVNSNINEEVKLRLADRLNEMEIEKAEIIQQNKELKSNIKILKMSNEKLNSCKQAVQTYCGM